MPTESKQELAGFRERALSAAGTRIRYFVGGEGPPLLLVHGLGGLASNWRLVAPALAEERRVVVPELPGHGGSGRLDGPASLDPFADTVLAVAEAEPAPPAPWAGP